jgi:hypothetical protein
MCLPAIRWQACTFPKGAWRAVWTSAAFVAVLLTMTAVPSGSAMCSRQHGQDFVLGLHNTALSVRKTVGTLMMCQ